MGLYNNWSDLTFIIVEDGDTIKKYEFHAIFSGSMATKESAERAAKKGKNDDDDEQNDGKETNEELRKLITIRIKYNCIWLLELYIQFYLIWKDFLTDYHLRLFGWVVLVRSSTKKKQILGGTKEFGMFVFTKKSGVTIKWIKYTTKAFDVDRDLVNHTGPTVQFRLEEPAIVALAQAKHVNLPLVISLQIIINWRTLYGDK